MRWRNPMRWRLHHKDSRDMVQLSGIWLSSEGRCVLMEKLWFSGYFLQTAYDICLIDCSLGHQTVRVFFCLWSKMECVFFGHSAAVFFCCRSSRCWMPSVVALWVLSGGPSCMLHCLAVPFTCAMWHMKNMGNVMSIICNIWCLCLRARVCV